MSDTPKCGRCAYVTMLVYCDEHRTDTATQALISRLRDTPERCAAGRDHALQAALRLEEQEREIARLRAALARIAPEVAAPATCGRCGGTGWLSVNAPLRKTLQTEPWPCEVCGGAG